MLPPALLRSAAASHTRPEEGSTVLKGGSDTVMVETGNNWLLFHLHMSAAVLLRLVRAVARMIKHSPSPADSLWR